MRNSRKAVLTKKVQPQHYNKDGNTMRTVRTKIYKFDELTETAKETAIQYYRNNLMDNSFIYDDAHSTVKAFHKLFGTKESGGRWLEINTAGIDDNVLNLDGLRLQKYIWNNFGKELYKGKYYSLWSETEISYKHHKEGHPVLKFRHSKVMFENSCVLTGMAWDDAILSPVYELLDNYSFKKDYNSYLDYETLLNDCIASLEKAIDEDIESRNGADFISEEIRINGYEFTKDGHIFREK